MFNIFVDILNSEILKIMQTCLQIVSNEVWQAQPI